MVLMAFLMVEMTFHDQQMIFMYLLKKILWILCWKRFDYEKNLWDFVGWKLQWDLD